MVYRRLLHMKSYQSNGRRRNHRSTFFVTTSGLGVCLDPGLSTLTFILPSLVWTHDIHLAMHAKARKSYQGMCL
jgi:hypothetical protein